MSLESSRADVDRLARKMRADLEAWLAHPELLPIKDADARVYRSAFQALGLAEIEADDQTRRTR